MDDFNDREKVFLVYCVKGFHLINKYHKRFFAIFPSSHEDDSEGM